MKVTACVFTSNISFCFWLHKKCDPGAGAPWIIILVIYKCDKFVVRNL